jgi:hypothetical protein
MKRVRIGIFIFLMMGLALSGLTYATGETLHDGFAGLSWGVKPEQVAGIVPVLPGYPPYLFYRLQPDPQDPIFGKARLLALIFSPERGLVQGWVAFQEKSAPVLLLWEYLGPQVMIEPMPGHPVKPTWFPGKNTRVEEDDGSYLFSCRNVSEELDSAVIRQAMDRPE